MRPGILLAPVGPASATPRSDAETACSGTTAASSREPPAESPPLVAFGDEVRPGVAAIASDLPALAGGDIEGALRGEKLHKAVGLSPEADATVRRRLEARHSEARASEARRVKVGGRRKRGREREEDAAMGAHARRRMSGNRRLADGLLPEHTSQVGPP